MKIWRGYGSEHSANLIMIGHFRSPNDAEAALLEFGRLAECIFEEFDYVQYDTDRLSVYERPALRTLLEEFKLYDFGPDDIEHYMREHTIQRKEQRLVISTDEHDVGGFLKFLIEKGALVEVYSAHDYPDRDSDQPSSLLR